MIGSAVTVVVYGQLVRSGWDNSLVFCVKRPFFIRKAAFLLFVYKNWHEVAIIAL